MEYLDFDLEVTAADGGAFTVRVLRSPAGEATGTMRLPFDSLVLQNRLQALQIALLRSGSTRRRVDTPEAHTVEKFGEELWDALFSGDIRARFEASRAEARRLDSGMRIKLRFEDASLAALPWEYLFDAGRGDYVTLSASTPVVRYIPLPQVMEPLAVRPPLRVLGMIASPSDLDALDVERERQRLGQALSKLSDAGLVELTWMTGSTTRDLQAMLRRGPWHIFHFVGHGGFDANRGEGLIVLTNEDGTSRRVSATDLGRLLGDHDPLRLAVLNACESARGDSVDVFASTAATLVRRGTPAVVAMQYEITDDAAIEFSRSFYEAIADAIPVDAALAEARKGVAMAIPGTLEWGTPVLYMRAPDGVLFDIPADARAAVVAPEAIDRPKAPAAIEPTVPAAAGPAPEREVAAPPPVVVPPPAVAQPLADPLPPVVDRPAAAAELGAAAAAGPPGVGQAVPPPPPAPAVRGPIPTGSTPMSGAPAPQPGAKPGAVPGWSATATASGGRRASRGNTKLIAGGLVVAVLVGGGVLAALGDNQNPPGPPTDGPISFQPFSTPTSPAVVPPVSDERHIVFANDSSGTADLYSVDPSGTEPVQLTSGAGDDRYPAVSPDGRWIAFSRFEDGQGALWVMAANGGDPRKVTDGAALDWAATWLPDDSALVFSSNRFETNKLIGDLFMVRLDGSAPPTLVVGLQNFDEDMAAVSGNGRIAFSTDGGGNSRSIDLLDGIGSIPRQLTDGLWVDSQPVWWPDRDTILFVRSSVSDPATGDLWTVRASDTNALIQLTNDAAAQSHPAVSPDGSGYAYQEDVGASYHIMLFEGSGPERDLTSGLGGSSYEPTW